MDFACSNPTPFTLLSTDRSTPKAQTAQSTSLTQPSAENGYTVFYRDHIPYALPTKAYFFK
jgi:hypothetical protein